MPSPTVLGLSGSVPRAISTPLDKPSPSSSLLGSRIWRVFAGDAIRLDVPEPLLATRVNAPETFAPMVMLRVAVVPEGSTETEPTLIAGGANAGRNENVAPVKFAPVTTKLEKVVAMGFWLTTFGLIDRTEGAGMTVKLA